MKNLIPQPDSDFKSAMSSLKKNKELKPYLFEIADKLEKNQIDYEEFKEILERNNVDYHDAKEDFLDFLLSYIDSILEDGIITEKELANIKTIKRLFKIREGDFFKLRLERVQSVLNKQFEKILEDQKVDKKEAVLKVGLQELFDLGYDQFQELSMEKIRKALEDGADLNDLDVVLKL